MGYGNNTYNSRNPLVRFAHRSRFGRSLRSVDASPGDKILDFGSGDGFFLDQLNERVPGLELLAYEPYMEAREGCEIETTSSWDRVLRAAPYDCVTCFEVLEHFPAEGQEVALDRFLEVLRPEGRLVISVPIERGLPSVVKNLVRKRKYPQHPAYALRNIAASLLGRPLPAYRGGSDYLSHMGFYFDDLELLLSPRFEIVNRSFSPFPGAGAQFNSQVFYELTPRPQEAVAAAMPEAV